MAGHRMTATWCDRGRSPLTVRDGARRRSARALPGAGRKRRHTMRTAMLALATIRCRASDGGDARPFRPSWSRIPKLSRPPRLRGGRARWRRRRSSAGASSAGRTGPPATLRAAWGPSRRCGRVRQDPEAIRFPSGWGGPPGRSAGEVDEIGPLIDAPERPIVNVASRAPEARGAGATICRLGDASESASVRRRHGLNVVKPESAGR
jgi:hypothetical protein